MKKATANTVKDASSFTVSTISAIKQILITEEVSLKKPVWLGKESNKDLTA